MREALAEREVLLRAAPHIIWPLRFVLPHEPHLRPAWMIRAGLFLYDHLGGRETLPRLVQRRSAPARRLRRSPEARTSARASSIPTCWVDDARLVVLNAHRRRRARRHGVRTRRAASTRGAAKACGSCGCRRDEATRREIERARALVNAAGPWVSAVLDAVQRTRRTREACAWSRAATSSCRKRAFEHDHAYILQNPDKRIVFVIPTRASFTLIGTTDVRTRTARSARRASIAGRDRLPVRAASRYLARAVGRRTWSGATAGVRPLLRRRHRPTPRPVTRDYVLELDLATAGRGPPLLSVFGGKITTYRQLAEAALAELARLLPAHEERMDRSERRCPGGDLAGSDFAACERELAARYPGLPAWLSSALVAPARHATSTACSARQGPPATSARTSAAGCTSAELDYLVAARMGAHGRRRAVAAHQVRPAYVAGAARRGQRVSARAIRRPRSGPGREAARAICRPPSGAHPRRVLRHRRHAYHRRASSWRAAYAALERLRAAGLLVIPITGRPAGWCDHIARMWPVDAVVGENGAFYFRHDAGRAG